MKEMRCLKFGSISVIFVRKFLYQKNYKLITTIKLNKFVEYYAHHVIVFWDLLKNMEVHYLNSRSI